MNGPGWIPVILLKISLFDEPGKVRFKAQETVIEHFFRVHAPHQISQEFDELPVLIRTDLVSCQFFGENTSHMNEEFRKFRNSDEREPFYDGRSVLKSVEFSSSIQIVYEESGR